MSAASFKDSGNQHLQAKQYDLAIEAYSEAIRIDPTDKVFYSNRSAAYLSKGDAVNALKDAKKSVELDPSWPKGHSRVGAALHALHKYQEAIVSYQAGLTISPSDAGLQSGLKEVEKILGAKDAHRKKWTVEAFGSQLLTKQGLQNTVDVLANKKYVAVYFSAHWCPPCRQFTPVLGEFYDTLKDEKEDALEVIFASSDNDVNQFNEYYHEMPWTSIPYSNRQAVQFLSTKFNVSGIPAMFVLELATGDVKDADGRSTIMNARGSTSKVLTRWGG